MSAAEEADVPVDRFGLVGTTLDNKFRIDRLVAEGGFGVVYQGLHMSLERPIAIKVLKTPAEYNDDAKASFREKFALEAKTIARISHPNIVQVLDFGVSQMPTGELAPWMVLEWLTGLTLEEALEARRGRGGRAPQEAFALLKSVLEALAYAHDEGIAHRDIKPANIMCVETKRGTSLRLMDFGIAKLMDEGETAGSGATRTRSTVNAFSPQYAAPEQLSGTRSGPWTDVHALALIVSEVLTDQQPYEGEDMTALFVEVMSPQRPTPLKRNIDVGAWEPVLQRALGLKPDDRYRNAGEFLQALEQAMPGATFGPAGGSAFIDAPTMLGGHQTQSLKAASMLMHANTIAAPAGSLVPSGSGIFTAEGLQLAPPPPDKSRWQWVAVAIGTVVVMASLGTIAGLKVREAQSAARLATQGTATAIVTALPTAPVVATVTALPTAPAVATVVATALPTVLPTALGYPPTAMPIMGFPSMMPTAMVMPTAAATARPRGNGPRPPRATAAPSDNPPPRPTASTGAIPLE